MTPAASTWSFEPLFLVLAALAGFLYLRAAGREPVPSWRIGLFGAGLILVAGALNSPLETVASHYLLLVHLLQNVMIADWAPPLLILGLTPRMRVALAARGGRPWALLTRPRVALPVWLVGWYAIHLAGLYDLALENPWALNVEHGLLIAIGTLFWWPALAGEPHALATPLTLAYLAAGFVGSAFLGLALTFSPSVFYDFYADAPRLWGISAIKDQNLGGILMSAEQALIFFTAITCFLVRLLKEEEAAHSTRR